MALRNTGTATSRYSLQTAYTDIVTSSNAIAMSFYLKINSEPSWPVVSGQRRPVNLWKMNTITATGAEADSYITLQPSVQSSGQTNTGWKFAIGTNAYISEQYPYYQNEDRPAAGLGTPIANQDLNFGEWYHFTVVIRYGTYSSNGYTHPKVDTKIYINNTLKYNNKQIYVPTNTTTNFTSSSNGITGFHSIQYQSGVDSSLDRLWMSTITSSEFDSVEGTDFNGDLAYLDLGTDGETEDGITAGIYCFGNREDFWYNRGTLDDSANDVVFDLNANMTTVDSIGSSLNPVNFFSTFNQNTVGGIVHPASISISSETISSQTANNIIKDAVNLSSQITSSQSANNTVGFPDTTGQLEYTDDDYAGDGYTLQGRSYVEEGYALGGYFDYEYVGSFDRQMRQDLNWDAQTDFLGGYKVAGATSILADVQTSQLGGIIQPASSSISADTQSTFSGGRIRQGDFDVAGDFTTTGLGGNAIVAEGSFLLTTQFSPIGIVEIIPEANILADAQIDITGGYLQSTGSVTLGSENALTISYDTGTSAGVIIDVESAIASDYALTETVTNVIDGANNFASDFVLSETSGYLHDGQGSLVSEATWTPTLPSIIEANQMFATSSFATNFSGGRLRQAEADLQAQLVFEPEALRIPVPEPYRTYTVKTETRNYTIEQETRVFDVKSETRINNVTTESRVYLVPSETRTLEVLPDLTIRQVAGRRVGERV